MMKWLQKLGKAHASGSLSSHLRYLMGIGYLMCPETMQGGDISGVVPVIGLFLVKAGGALIDSMADSVCYQRWRWYGRRQGRYG